MARDAFIAEYQAHAQRADPTLPALAPHQLIRWQQAVAIAPEADTGKTALLVSHKDQAILWDHYLGVATAEDAGRYFRIEPIHSTLIAKFEPVR